MSIFINGGQVFPGDISGTINIVEITTDYNTLVTDDVIVATGGSLTINLHSLASAVKNIVIKCGAGIITINPNGSETIDGAPTQRLTSRQSITLSPIPTGWLII